MTDNIIDRDELQEKLIRWDLSQMSLDDLKEYFINMQNAELDCLSVDELIEEVKQYNPHLLAKVKRIKPVSRLAQATFRFSFVVLYHHELPDPIKSAILPV